MQYQRLTDNTSIIIRENGESQLLSSTIGANQCFSRQRRMILILLSIQLVNQSFLLSFYWINI